MKSMSKKLLSVSLTLALVAPLAIACTKAEPKDTDTNRVLRIATSFGYGSDDEYFRQQFTEIYEFANPNVKIEIVPTMDDKYRYRGPEPGEKMPDPMEKLKEVMQGDNPPDLVMVSYEQLPDLINNNLLSQLDPLITKDKFDTTDIVPAVIDGIKNAGGGKLFALSPTFSSSALIYNKKIFNDAGVEFPKDGMTWDETFDLAKRVASGEGESRIDGFSFNTQAHMDLFYGMLQYYIAPLQLTMFDDAGEKMTVDTDQWEKVWSKMLQLQKDKVVPELFDPSKPMERKMEENNPFAYDDFISGRLGMAIMYYGQINQLVSANKSAESFKNFTPVEWDVVTMPSHPEAKGVGGSIFMNGIMGINAKAQNAEDAWEFIKFVNGEDWARLKSHSSYNLVARKKYLQPKDGLEFNIQAFYNVIPSPAVDNYKVYRDKPSIGQVNEIGHQLFQQVLQDKLAVRDALKQWQTQGDALLQQIKENPNGPIIPMGNISAEQ